MPGWLDWECWGSRSCLTYFIFLTANWCLCGERRGQRCSLHFFVLRGCEILICCLFKNGFEGQVEALVVTESETVNSRDKTASRRCRAESK